MFNFISQIAQIALAKFPVLRRKRGAIVAQWDGCGLIVLPVKIVKKEG